MIQTIHYKPAEPEKFWRNIQRKWSDYSYGVAHYNSKESRTKRTNRELIYHILDASVFVRRANERLMVSISAKNTKSNNKIEEAKSILEEISNVHLMEVH